MDLLKRERMQDGPLCPEKRAKHNLLPGGPDVPCLPSEIVHIIMQLRGELALQEKETRRMRAQIYWLPMCHELKDIMGSRELYRKSWAHKRVLYITYHRVRAFNGWLSAGLDYAVREKHESNTDKCSRFFWALPKKKHSVQYYVPGISPRTAYRRVFLTHCLCCGRNMSDSMKNALRRLRTCAIVGDQCKDDVVATTLCRYCKDRDCYGKGLFGLHGGKSYLLGLGVNWYMSHLQKLGKRGI